MGLDYQAFERLALAELPSVNRVARALTRSKTDADDLVQESYLKAIRSWRSFELRESGIRPWLMTIMNRTHLNRIRQSRRQAEYLTTSNVEDLSAPTEVLPTIEVIDWTQFDGRLLGALQELPDVLRTTLVMWAMQDLTYQEIASSMEIPIGTVMSRLHRARGLMHKALTGEIRGKEMARE